MAVRRNKVPKRTVEKLSTHSMRFIVQDIQRFFVKERIANNWSQKDMAQILGISQSSVSRLESGEYLSFSFGLLMKLSEKLGYEPHIVFLRSFVPSEQGGDSAEQTLPQKKS